MEDKVISMNDLGHNGRFGNQLFQYAFLKYVSEKFGYEIYTPPWIGNTLFMINDEICFSDYITISEDEICSLKDLSIFEKINITGFFQDKKWIQYYSNNKALFQNLFLPKESIHNYLMDKYKEIISRKILAIHLRFGDYGFDHFFRSNPNWIYPIIDEIISKNNDIIIYIATDEPIRAKKYFQSYNPILNIDFPKDKILPPFYSDFWVMTQADFLIIANSSFSYAASLLNRNIEYMYRPSLVNDKLIKCIPWNESAILFESNKINQWRGNHIKVHNFLCKIERKLKLW